MGFLKFLLAPFSLIYSFILRVRNGAFDNAWIKTYKSSMPTLSIGNLSTGGTGKTPHIIAIGKILEKQYPIAVLSRGYGRKTKGYREVEAEHSATECGDEPLMIKKRNAHWFVAVEEKRVDGAKRIEKLKKPFILLLDDAYQHRYLQRDINIMLSRFDRPFFKDHVLPMGRLRESRKAASRADICIVSHCPKDLSAGQTSSYREAIQAYSNAPVFFTRMKAGSLLNSNGGRLSSFPKKALILAGIANPHSFIATLKSLSPSTEFLKLIYSDHHHFSSKDVDEVAQKAVACEGHIITTEKDWVRLPLALVKHPKLQISYLPIEVEFLEEKEMEFSDWLQQKLSLLTEP